MTRAVVVVVGVLVCCLGLTARAQERGPYRLIGRTPDRTLYACGSSASGTRIPGGAVNITDGACVIWTLVGSSVTRNGVAVDSAADQVLYYGGNVYDRRLGNWYRWIPASSTWTLVGADPEAPAVSGYYVSTTGSDANTCMQSLSATSPRRTVAAGITCLSAGETLLVRAGTYAENLGPSFPSGTSWSNKVRIAAYPGESVWLSPTAHSLGGNVLWFDCNCHYIEFDGINLDGRPGAQTGVWTTTNSGNNPHHIRIQNAEIIAGRSGAQAAISFGAHLAVGATGSNEAINMTLHGGGIPGGGCGFACNSYGVYLAGPNNLVDGCNIYGTTGAGIQIYNADGDLATGNIIRNTRIHDVVATEAAGEYWGIVVIGPNTQIYNNILSNLTLNTGSGADAAISVGCATGVCANNSKIWNNTIYNAVNGGILISGTSGVEVRNNIVYGGGGQPYANAGTGTTHTNNLEGPDPLFVNAPANNFQLQAGSAAVNTGVCLAGVTADIVGVARPQGSGCDMGAYER